MCIRDSAPPVLPAGGQAGAGRQPESQEPDLDGQEERDWLDWRSDLCDTDEEVAGGRQDGDDAPAGNGEPEREAAVAEAWAAIRSSTEAWQESVALGTDA
eukprot:3040601-Alexandrium_andersonii.AAC.1